jgi:hypothetical protein
MPNTCETCQHWRKVAARDVRAEGAVGECRAQPPIADFRWPRTAASHFCSHYGVATTAEAQATLSLDANPDTGSALPSQGDSSGNRPRRAGGRTSPRSQAAPGGVE